MMTYAHADFSMKFPLAINLDGLCSFVRLRRFVQQLTLANNPGLRGYLPTVFVDVVSSVFTLQPSLCVRLWSPCECAALPCSVLCL